MIVAEVHVPNRLGLHARAAARFVHAANAFEARIFVTVAGGDGAGTGVDGKSILGLLTLAAARGTRLRVAADGADARAAVDELTKLIEDGFGEGCGVKER